MATKYIRADGGGSDSNSGDDYANAWATIDKCYTYLNASGVKGDRFRLVNDGIHTAPTAAVTAITASLAGTDYDTDPGFIIEGTDSSGNPALTTVQGASASARFVSITSGVNYVVVRGLFLDYTTVDPGNGSAYSSFNGATSGPIRFEYCYLQGYTDNHASIGTAIRTIFDNGGTPPPDWGEVRYSVIHNCSSPADFNAGTTQTKGRIHHCVWIWIGDFTAANWVWRSTAVSTGVCEFYSNTCYISTTDIVTRAHLANPASGDYGLVNWHSNVFWINTTTSVSDVFDGSAGSTATNTGTIGYNIFYFGPDTASGDVSNRYEDPWDDGEDPKSTDVAAYEQADTVLFNDPSSSWVWNANNSDYELTLPKDLRIILHTTSGLAGILPGALPSFETDYTVNIVTSIANPEPDETIQLTVIVANSGTAASSVVLTAAVPAGLTYVSYVASQGTYASDTWTVGSIASGTSKTLTITCTVDSDQSGQSIDATATWTSGDPASDPDTSDNTDTVTITVQDTDSVGGDSGIIPYLDVLPIIGVDLQMTFNGRLSTKKNRASYDYKRFDIESRRYREYSSKYLVLQTNTTTTVNMGGIERARILVVESDTPVQVSTNLNTNTFKPAAKYTGLVRGSVEKLVVKNSSTTNTATIYITLVD